LISFKNPSTLTSRLESLDVSGFTSLKNATTFRASLNKVGNINTSGLSVFGINSALSTNQNNSTFSNPFLNASSTISLKYDGTKFNIDAPGT
jgi:hypothetical protein